MIVNILSKKKMKLELEPVPFNRLRPKITGSVKLTGSDIKFQLRHFSSKLTVLLLTLLDENNGTTSVFNEIEMAAEKL